MQICCKQLSIIMAKFDADMGDNSSQDASSDDGEFLCDGVAALGGEGSGDDPDAASFGGSHNTDEEGSDDNQAVAATKRGGAKAKAKVKKAHEAKAGSGGRPKDAPKHQGLEVLLWMRQVASQGRIPGWVDEVSCVSSCNPQLESARQHSRASQMV